MKTSLKPAKEAWKRHGHGVMEFPHYVPRVPRLEHLCSVYPIGLSLPDWWKEFILEIQSRNFELPIIELFRSVTPEEFREGQIEVQRYKEVRGKLSEQARRVLPSSPKIGKVLVKQFGANHPFTISFNDRGNKHDEKEIVITGDPWDIVTMSTRGKSWTSCQDFYKGGKPSGQVWANLCDPGMAIVYVRTQGDRSEKDIDTRVIIRYFWTYRRNPKDVPTDGVVLDRFYGDASYVRAIQDLLFRIVQEQGLVLFEYAQYNSQQQGAEVRRMSQGNRKVLTVRGPSVDFRGAPLPYMDNAIWKEEKKSKSRGHHRLEAKVYIVLATCY